MCRFQVFCQLKVKMLDSGEGLIEGMEGRNDGQRVET